MLQSKQSSADAAIIYMVISKLLSSYKNLAYIYCT